MVNNVGRYQGSMAPDYKSAILQTKKGLYDLIVDVTNKKTINGVDSDSLAYPMAVSNEQSIITEVNDFVSKLAAFAIKEFPAAMEKNI